MVCVCVLYLQDIRCDKKDTEDGKVERSVSMQRVVLVASQAGTDLLLLQWQSRVLSRKNTKGSATLCEASNILLL